MIQSSDFIGCIVNHKVWGEGVIETFDNSSLVAHFLKTNTGERSVGFQFPQAFVDGFLFFTEPTLQNNISQLIEENKCCFCGAIGIQTEVIDGKRVCNKCKKDHMTKCPFCNELHESDSMLKYYPDEDSSHSVLICSECANNNTFICERCNKRLHINHKVVSKVSNKTICKKCLPNVVKECHFCKTLFDINIGDTFYDYAEGGTVDVCPDCLATHTFTCTECGYEKLITSRFVSEHITDDCNVCKSCVSTCSICNEHFPDSKIIKSFGKNVCPHCWEKLKKQCPICDDEYIPELPTDQLCPDCVKMHQYEERITRIDFSSFAYKKVNYSSLEYMDRCKLFTELFVHNNNSPVYNHQKGKSEPFNFIVMNILGYNVMITHLSHDIIKDALHSVNVTMTEFRSRKGRWKVYENIKKWLPTSTKTISTSAGEMTILNYPVLLRVQTEYDKIYGKEWNGPDDYIEIGNYGDTTDFYIIGCIK